MKLNILLLTLSMCLLLASKTEQLTCYSCKWPGGSKECKSGPFDNIRTTDKTEVKDPAAPATNVTVKTTTVAPKTTTTVAPKDHNTSTTPSSSAPKNDLTQCQLCEKKFKKKGDKEEVLRSCTDDSNEEPGCKEDSAGATICYCKEEKCNTATVARQLQVWFITIATCVSAIFTVSPVLFLFGAVNTIA